MTATRDENRRNAAALVENVIAELGLNPVENRLNSVPLPSHEPAVGMHAWGLRRGSAEVFIFINPGGPADHPSENFIQCISPVLKLPDSEAICAALHRRLLELNGGTLAGAAFGLRENTVVLTTDRSTIDLDTSEVRTMVTRIGYYADLYDDQLVNEFGGQRFCD